MAVRKVDLNISNAIFLSVKNIDPTIAKNEKTYKNIVNSKNTHPSIFKEKNGPESRNSEKHRPEFI